MIGFWPFNASKCMRDAIRKQVEDNAILSEEHQAVTDRIIEKAERITRLVNAPKPALAGHHPHLRRR